MSSNNRLHYLFPITIPRKPTIATILTLTSKRIRFLHPITLLAGNPLILPTKHPLILPISEFRISQLLIIKLLLPTGYHLAGFLIPFNNLIDLRFW